MYHSNEYIKKNPSWHAEDSEWKALNILRIMRDNNINPASIAEVGCGAGEILSQLYPKLPSHINYCGYEIAPDAYKLSLERARERLTFFLKDMIEDELKFFDVVMAIDVFEHCQDYLGFLRKIKEKGRYKIFHIPLDISVQTVLRVTPILRQRELVGHLHYFTKETALATLKDIGYKTIDYFYTSGSIDLPSKSLRRALLRLPRKMFFFINRDLTVRLLGGFSLMVLAE